MIVASAEIEEGNIEYKRHFVNVTNTRLNQLTAQMNWRINEGNGICYYYLGVCDDGTLYENFTQEEIDYSLDIIKMMADGCNSYIEDIFINRINNCIWLNITIRRKNEYMNEYRINFEANNLKKLMKKEGLCYKSTRDIYFNTIIHNNEKFLFFECKNKKNINHIHNIIDFNLTVNKNFDNLFNLINYVEKNMVGNNYNDGEPIFNIIRTNYIESVGYIISGFLKQGKLSKGMMLMSNKYNLICQIISIHNNQIDCNNIIAPATISINVLINQEFNKLDGILISNKEFNNEINKPHDQNGQVYPLPLDLQQQRQERRTCQLLRKAERRALSHGRMGLEYQ